MVQVEILKANLDHHGVESTIGTKNFSFTGGVVVKIKENPKVGSINAPLKFFGLVVDDNSTTVEVSSFNRTFNPHLGDAVIGMRLYYICIVNNSRSYLII